MLSLQRCRFLLGPDCKLSDSQLEQLLEDIYALADIAVESCCAKKVAGADRGAKPHNDSGCLSAIPGPERDGVEERAAILEFEGGLAKPAAERQAFGEWVQAQKGPDRPPKKPGNRKRQKSKKPRKPRKRQAP